jgi:serine/threonine-protein kinase
VLYEAITGRAPFSATNYHALLRAIVEDRPTSIVELAAGDEALWGILMRGMAKDRRDRYPSMLELGQALAAWLLSHGVREDAAGASVASKWLGRSSDPSGLGARSLAASASSADFVSKATQESHPGGTGIERGPFTHTILPHASKRKRMLGVLGAVAVLSTVAALLLVLLRPSRPETAIALHASLPSVISAANAPPVVTLEPPSPAIPPPPPLPPSAVTPVVESATPSEPSRPQKPTAHGSGVAPSPGAQPGTRAANPSPAASGSAPKISAAAVSTTAPAKARDRPLDLLAPY